MSYVNRQERSVVVKGIASTLSDGTAISGETVDRLGYESAIATLSYEASSGTPTAATASFLIQHGDASNLSDAATFATFETALNIKTAGFKYYNINLSGAKRYIRLVEDTTYTDGTSPKNQLSADIVLFDKNNDPAGSTTIYP